MRALRARMAGSRSSEPVSASREATPALVRRLARGEDRLGLGFGVAQVLPDDVGRQVIATPRMNGSAMRYSAVTWAPNGAASAQGFQSSWAAWVWSI